jgi:GT2 family glycosyltransferase
MHRYQISTITLPEKPDLHKSWLHDSRINEGRNAAMQMVPAQYFIITEDDCMFTPDWLAKFDAVLQDNIGAVGGPDVLPEGLGWFPRALDCILNSFLGTAGTKSEDCIKKDWFYPRQQNTVFSAKVIERIGHFPEDMILGVEMEMANRIRNEGWQIKYLPDNPVWHWRETTFFRFVRRNLYLAAEKVKILRRQHVFIQSPHFFVFIITVLGLVLGLTSLLNTYALAVFLILMVLYLAIVITFSIASFVRTRSITVSLGVLLLLPSHHLSITIGVLKGVVSKS